jgi:hypothetical protein
MRATEHSANQPLNQTMRQRRVDEPLGNRHLSLSGARHASGLGATGGTGATTRVGSQYFVMTNLPSCSEASRFRPTLSAAAFAGRMSKVLQHQGPRCGSACADSTCESWANGLSPGRVGGLSALRRTLPPCLLVDEIARVEHIVMVPPRMISCSVCAPRSRGQSQRNKQPGEGLLRGLSARLGGRQIRVFLASDSTAYQIRLAESCGAQSRTTPPSHPRRQALSVAAAFAPGFFTSSLPMHGTC